MMPGPTREFWEERFRDGHTPWDRGEVNPQLSVWLAAGDLSPCRIVVPGCGAGYELAALAAAGFNVTGLDYAPLALERARQSLIKAGQTATLVEADVLVWQPERPFDAIYEQTCLCALYPDQWFTYAEQLHRWLRPGGRLYALFVQYPRPGAAEGCIQGPPYHCDINAMRAIFPEPRWLWRKPPYPRTTHPRDLNELAIVLERAA